MQKVKNVILDYGNVIFMIDFPKVRQAFMDLGIKNVDEFFGHHGQDSLFDAFDKGEISVPEFRDGVRRKADRYDLSDEQIDTAWNSLLIGVPEGKHEILENLRDNYRTFLCSNNNELHYAYCMNHIQEKYGVPSNDVFFERTYYSHLEGLRKPDAAIFERVLEQNNLIPEESLFVDDSPQHLEGAKKLGIQTVLCSAERPLEQIVADLKLY
ncbi:HAD family phosphatase [Sphingobacterium sp.]|uniref:HAD family hydrolase n=1 Tax=Sphingobacterium sp. TaxID=341027 RepID=UPI0028A67D0E|nr:HAD family phosphatase [Sphingobacterium sp.]